MGGCVVILLIVVSFELVSKWLEFSKKEGSKRSLEDQKLQDEIKQLLKEASSYSQPSTFAQAAKLRRLAATKQKELSNSQELHKKEIGLSCDLYLRVLSIAKNVIYFVLICWFWRVPVSTVSHQLVQPFGKMLSWSGGGISNDTVMVGVIPWLMLSSRFSKLVCRLVKF